MQLRFTAAGKNIFDTNPTAFTVTRLVLTDAFGYTLAPVPSALQGDIVYDETADLSIAIDNTNTLRFTKLLDDTVGSFEFGEAGLYSGATLVAIGVNPTPIQKVAASGADNGNHMTLNFFLTYNNTNSYGFVTLGNSDNRYQLGQVQHLDYLNPPFEGDPNAYVVNGLTPSDVPDFAFVDFFGRWNFASKPQRYYSGEVLTASATAVDISTPHGIVFGVPTDYIIQFISGRLRGYCRELVSIGGTFFEWNTPTLITAEPGDQFLIVGPRLANVTIAGQANIQFQNEGTNLGSAGTVNEFDVVGPNVTASRAGNKVTLNVGNPAVPAGIQFQDEGANLGSPGTVDTFNVVAPNGALTRSGNTVTLTLDEYPNGFFQAPLQFRDEGDNLGIPGDVETIDFVGSGVTASLVDTTLTVTVDGGVNVLTYNLSSSSLGAFGGIGYTDWTITPLYAVPPSPFVSIISPSQIFEFNEPGTYKVTICTNIDGGEGLPNLLSVFGWDLGLTLGANVFSAHPSSHSRFSDPANPGDNGSLVFSPWFTPYTMFTWTDTFYIQTGIGGRMDPTLFTYNYNEPTATHTPSALISIEKISPLTA